MSDNLTILIENSIDSKRKTVLKKMFVILRFVEKSELSPMQEKDLQKELQGYPFSELAQISTGQLKKKFKKLQHFVSNKFGYVHKGYYSYYYMSIGMTLGLSIGMAIFDPTIGISTGMMFGLFIGAQFGLMKDKRAEKENRVYYIR